MICLNYQYFLWKLPFYLSWLFLIAGCREDLRPLDKVTICWLCDWSDLCMYFPLPTVRLVGLLLTLAL